MPTPFIAIGKVEVQSHAHGCHLYFSTGAHHFHGGMPSQFVCTPPWTPCPWSNCPCEGWGRMLFYLSATTSGVRARYSIAIALAHLLYWPTESSWQAPCQYGVQTQWLIVEAKASSLCTRSRCLADDLGVPTSHPKHVLPQMCIEMGMPDSMDRRDNIFHFCSLALKLWDIHLHHANMRVPIVCIVWQLHLPCSSPQYLTTLVPCSPQGFLHPAHTHTCMCTHISTCMHAINTHMCKHHAVHVHTHTPHTCMTHTHTHHTHAVRVHTDTHTACNHAHICTHHMHTC